MAHGMKRGYGIVADDIAFETAHEMAHHHDSVVAIKAHPRWMTGSGAGEVYEQLRAGEFMVIVDSMVGAAGSHFSHTLAQYAGRIIPDVITLSPGLTDRQITEIAKIRTDTPGFEYTWLALTACLPECPPSDFPRGVRYFTQKKFELANKIGGALVYGAGHDITHADEDLLLTVPFMAAGISEDGLNYNDKNRGVVTPKTSIELGATIVLLGTILGKNPGLVLSRMPRI